MNTFENNDCEVYLKVLEGEHQRLNARFQEFRHLLLNMADTAQPTPELITNVKQNLHEITAELKQHFKEEREGGCLEEAVSRCPTLAHDVALIEAQHTALLLQLENLDNAIQQGDYKVLDQFEHFVHALDEHEALENRTVRHGFNADE